MDEQPLEHQDLSQSMGVSMAAMTPAAVEAIKTPVAAELQAEPSTAPLIPAAGVAGEDTVSPTSAEHQEEATTAHVSPAAEEEQHRSPLNAMEQEEEKAPAPASPCFDELDSRVAAEPQAEPSMDKQQTPTQAPAPRQQVHTERALQVSFRHKVRRAPFHSTPIHSLPSHPMPFPTPTPS